MTVNNSSNIDLNKCNNNNKDSSNNNNNNTTNIENENENQTNKSYLNIYVNEPIPIKESVNLNKSNNVQPIINDTNNIYNNANINPTMYLNKFKIIDLRSSGSGAKHGHGFSEIVPIEINHLINQNDFKKFIKSFNRIFNYFYLLLINVFFLIGGIIFPIFVSKVSLLWSVIGCIIIIVLGAIFHFFISKYVKSKRIIILEKKIKKFNMEMDSISIPLQFCLMRVQEAVPGKPHFSVERLIIRVTFSDERITRPIGNPEA